MQQNEVIAIVPALRKNAESGRDNDVGIRTYDLSKFAVVVVEKLGKTRYRLVTTFQAAGRRWCTKRIAAIR